MVRAFWHTLIGPKSVILIHCVADWKRVVQDGNDLDTWLQVGECVEYVRGLFYFNSNNNNNIILTDLMIYNEKSLCCIFT